MNNKTKYDMFDKIVQEKMNDYSNEYGKSWNEINNALNNSRTRSHKTLIITQSTLLIIISILIGIYFISDNENNMPPENIIQQKNIATQAKNKKILENKITENDIKSNKIEKEIIPIKKRKQEVELYSKENPIKITSQPLTIKENIPEKKSIILDSNELIINTDTLTKEFKIISNKYKGCRNDSFHISTKSPSNWNIKWIINDTFYSNQNEIYFLPKYSGDNKILLKLNKKDKSLTFTDSLILKINEIPNIDFNYENTEDNGIISTYFTINNDENHPLEKGSFYWDFGDNKYCNDEFAVHHYLKNGKFSVILYYTSTDGCEQKLEKEIEITYNFDILAPNSFTPNGDGINDIFMPEGVKINGQPFEMNIYNKKGELIFITKNVQNGWNGFNQKSGAKCGNDNYLWVIKLQNEIGNFEYYKGTIQIIN